jgi:cobalt-zinc-cadmium efflux system membrane fusion protein
VQNGLLILRSGINGYIAKQNVILGESVDINKLIFRIHSHRKLWVVAYVPVDDIRNLRKGMRVTVISPIGVTTGKLDFISHKVDPKTKRVEARIIADNRNEVLKPNMFVEVQVGLDQVEGLFVPVSAVIKEDGKYYVFLKKGDKFKPVQVSIGDRYGKYYEVLEGLKEGDEVVVKGAIYLKAKFFGEAEE